MAFSFSNHIIISQKQNFLLLVLLPKRLNSYRLCIWWIQVTRHSWINFLTSKVNDFCNNILILPYLLKWLTFLINKDIDWSSSWKLTIFSYSTHWKRLMSPPAYYYSLLLWMIFYDQAAITWLNFRNVRS